MIKLLRNLKTDQSGASAAEYALMIALIGGVIIVAAAGLGTSIKGVFTGESAQVTTAAGNIGK